MARAPELEISADNWLELHAAGFRHFLNVAPEKLSENEFQALVSLARSAAERPDDFAFGAFYDDDIESPLDSHCDLGLYVRRAAGWTPF